MDDKLGKAGIADLLRSKNKVITNPFPEGQALVAAAHDTATYFHYGKRQAELLKCAGTVRGGSPRIKLQNDKSTTRVSPRLNMIGSVLRMNKALRMHMVANPEELPALRLNDDKFQARAARSRRPLAPSPLAPSPLAPSPLAPSARAVRLRRPLAPPTRAAYLPTLSR